MKLHFEPNLDYQLQAIEAVCDLFQGQEICRTEFTVTQQAQDGQMLLAMVENELGIGNRLTLLDDEIRENLHDIQLRNGLPPSIELKTGNFTVEMETGTGKTYVYLRTIFELNQKYGFSKFVIVVPSVAIKEGVFKALQITEEHFKGLYAGVPYEYFIYDSAKLGTVRNFATSSNIQIMVITVGAINKKDVNNLYKASEKTGGEKPIDLIRATRPILIVDEPQSVDGGLEGQGKKALGEMNALCTLRYSATHVDKHHMVYRLDAVDAYEQKLVKQIEVASATIEAGHNKPYVRLISVSNKRGTISARVEIDIKGSHSVSRQEINVSDGDLLELTTGRDVYHDCRIGEIRVETGNQYMELRVPGEEIFLKPGEIYGDVDHLAVQREMIRRTIKEHLEKEKRLRPQGIKVLSLFFIEKVDRYRQYDPDGNSIKGVYAKIFEEEYTRAARSPEYRTLFEEVDLSKAAEQVHDGYFSIDRKGGWTDTSDTNEPSRENAERAYNLIMKDKEKLLSFDTPLKFIFSHSALREGWDSPNVFQICTLRDISTERERRQTIGRGLRLCVNQDGERIRGFDINTLTVIAREGYEEFAANLQKEIEADTGYQFGIVEEHQFAGMNTSKEEGKIEAFGFDKSKELWEYLKDKGYLASNGAVKEELRKALKENTVEVPAEFNEQLEQIKAILRKAAGRLEIKNADERSQVRARQAILYSPEFKELWDRIKHNSMYRLHFDNEKLIEECTLALKNAPEIQKTRIQWRKANLAIGEAGIEATEHEGAATIVIDEHDIELPDIMTELQNRTQLTRRSIYRILVESERLNDFKRNPQDFIDLAGEAINRCKRLAIVDGIKYQKLGGDAYYAIELFEQNELTGYLKKMIDTEKSVYEKVVYDSDTEREFADALEKNEAIKVYAKLPGWFTIPTPLGTYNPDWAILVEKDGEERLYFVVETKEGLFADELRLKERAKIVCGTEHFKAIADNDPHVRFKPARKVEDILQD
jgi:type III restriction enzyme